MTAVILILIAAATLFTTIHLQQGHMDVGNTSSTDLNSDTKRGLDFTISRTWDGQSIPDNETVSVSLAPTENSNDVTMTIDAPFYDDPAPDGPPGEPFMKLWDYEVVEAFFLNDKDQYLEVEVGPHGQHIVLLLNGEKNAIKHSLPMDVTTNISGTRWVGTAVIPSEYFPPRVTKFNAYAINGVDDDRRYLALYYSDGSTAHPDFHNLGFFRPINMDKINEFLGCNREYSSVWTSSLAEN